MARSGDAADVIVVGAGSAGAPLAARLSERSDRTVVLVEAGPDYPDVAAVPPELLDPSDLSAAEPGHPNNWPIEVTFPNGGRLLVPRGRGLGGSSAINAGYFVRATRADLDRWGALGNDRWTWDATLPAFRRSETDRDHVAGRLPPPTAGLPTAGLHGSAGPLAVCREPADRAPAFTEAFTEACLAAGFPAEPDKNATGSGGVGPVPLNVADGRRVSTALAYLLPHRDRPNLRILGGVRVRRVVFAGNRAVGVEVATGPGRAAGSRVIRAGEVVLAAGALRSPQLLMLSGVGPADHLRAHGIDVVHDAPGVGADLADHPQLAAPFAVDLPMPNLPGRGAITAALHWSASVDGVDRALELLPFVARIGGPGADPFVVVGLMDGAGRGRVRLASADPDRAPLVEHRFLELGTDRGAFRVAVDQLLALAAAPPLRRIGVDVHGLGDAARAGTDSLDAWVRARLAFAGHACCTCRMGPAETGAVVDQRGRVHGVEALRVADTSIFPALPTRGPNATAVMVGERIAELFD